MEVFSALYATAAVLLILAGSAKVFRPDATERLLKDLRVPKLAAFNHRQMVRGLGSAEVALGVAALIVEISALALLIGLVFLAFAAVVTVAIRSGSASCGCFGRPDTPPTRAHIVANLALGVSALLASQTPTPLAVMEAQAAGGVGFVGVVGALAGGLFVLLGGRVRPA